MLRRTARWIAEQFAFLLVLTALVVAFAFLLVRPEQWRVGAAIISASALLAALLRLVLPSSRIGMLAARGRVVDTAVFLTLGVLVLAADLRLRT